MLKFSADTTETPSRPVLGIAIDRKTWDRLLNGPILFSTEGMDGLPSMKVYVMAGADDQSMVLTLQKLGILKDVVQIRDDPSLADTHAVRPADKEVN